MDASDDSATSTLPAADGTTAMTGKIHIPQYDTLTSAVQGGGLLLSSAGIKLTVSGNTSGSLNGFVAVNK